VLSSQLGAARIPAARRSSDTERFSNDRSGGPSMSGWNSTIRRSYCLARRASARPLPGCARSMTCSAFEGSGDATETSCPCSRSLSTPCSAYAAMPPRIGGKWLSTRIRTSALLRADDDVGIACRAIPAPAEHLESRIADGIADVAGVLEQLADLRHARALPFEMLGLEFDDEVWAGAPEQVFRATEGAKLGAFHVDLDEPRAVEELTRDPVERRHRD